MGDQEEAFQNLDAVVVKMNCLIPSKKMVCLSPTCLA